MGSKGSTDFDAIFSLKNIQFLRFVGLDYRRTHKNVRFSFDFWVQFDLEIQLKGLIAFDSILKQKIFNYSKSYDCLRLVESSLLFPKLSIPKVEYSLSWVFPKLSIP